MGDMVLVGESAFGGILTILFSLYRPYSLVSSGILTYIVYLFAYCAPCFVSSTARFDICMQ